MSLIILIEFHVISFLDIRKPYDQYINILEVPLGILSTFKLYLQKTLSLKISSRNDRLQKNIQHNICCIISHGLCVRYNYLVSLKTNVIQVQNDRIG